MNITEHVFSRIALPALMAFGLMPGLAWAQQPPLTGSMLETPRSSGESARISPTSPPAAPIEERQQAASVASDTDSNQVEENSSGRNDFGETTRGLFELQASGHNAGRSLPVLGEQASASYARYLKSFEYPIPEFLKTTVQTDAGN